MKKLFFIAAFVLATWALIVFAQQPDLIFSHKFHIEDVDAACGDCHGEALTSNSPGDNLLPTMETCYNCHEEDDTECTLCHTDPDAAGAVPRITGLKANFAHEKHAKSDDDCMKCHAGIVDKENPYEEKHIPGQAECIECHGNFDFAEENVQCVACHGKGFEFKPASHALTWKKNHGAEWQIDNQSCNHCHGNNYCTDCHQGDNLDRQSHPLNFKYNHGVQARANKDNCLTCHEESSSCIDCHQTELVMPKNHSYANWATQEKPGGLHSRQALYDFDYCSSCHNDAYSDNVCLRCHGE